MDGFLRLNQIIGDKHASPPVPALIPISKSAWYQGIQDGVFPAPIKLGRASAWKTADIYALMERATREGGLTLAQPRNSTGGGHPPRKLA